MELHRRCSRSNIPALVMLLLQLSVLLSGAAAVSVAMSETQVDVKEQLAELASMNLIRFEWDDTNLMICSDTVMVDGDSDSIQASLITSEDVTEVNNEPGTLDDSKMCATFSNLGEVDPFDGTFYRYDVAVLDKENNAVKTGEASFSAKFGISRLTCGGTTYYRVTEEGGGDFTTGGNDCLAMDFDDPSICYTDTLTENKVCVVPADSAPHEVTACATNIVPDTDTVQSEALTVSLNYDGMKLTFPAMDSATTSEAIVRSTDSEGNLVENKVYAGTNADVTLTDLLPSTNNYDMCVMGLDDTPVPVYLGTGSIQDTNLNLYDTGPLLEFGFANLNSKIISGGRFMYTVTAKTTDTTKANLGPVTLDCTAVDENQVCFGFLDLDTGAGDPGTMSVAFQTDDDVVNDINEITIPFAAPTTTPTPLKKRSE